MSDPRTSKSGSQLPAYLSNLSVPDSVKWQLADLAAVDPAVLLGMINASPDAFQLLLGSYYLDAKKGLQAMVGPGTSSAPVGRTQKLGAVVSEAPRQSKEWAAALRERDQLFKMYNEAKQGAFTRLPAEEVERQLNAFLQLPPWVGVIWAQQFEWILPYMAIAPLRCAPERATELVKLLGDSYVQPPQLSFDPKYTTFVSWTRRTVRFSPRLAEQLWPWAYTAAEAARQPEWGNITSGESGRLGQESRDWGHKAAFIGEKGAWVGPYPEDLPSPWNEAPETSLVGLAAEFLVHGAAAVLLHELGHLVRGHAMVFASSESDPRPPAEEADANWFATEWLLGRWKDYALAEGHVLARRSVGIVLLHCLISSLETVEGPPGAMRAYSPWPEALVHFLDGLTKQAQDHREIVLLVCRVARRVGWEWHRQFSSPENATQWAADVVSRYRSLS